MKGEEIYKIKRTTDMFGEYYYLLIKADLVGFTSETNKKYVDVNEEQYKQIKEFIEKFAENLGGFK